MILYCLTYYSSVTKQDHIVISTTDQFDWVTKEVAFEVLSYELLKINYEIERRLHPTDQRVFFVYEDFKKLYDTISNA